MSDGYTPWELARMAECADPDSDSSAGARFLLGIADSWAELDDPDEDSPHEIADAAVPVYTHELWQTFVDLAAYNEDPTELGSDADDMTKCAAVCLYMIGERLCVALAEGES